MATDHIPEESGSFLAEMGAIAARLGRSIETNPLKPGTRAWHAWRFGHRCQTDPEHEEETSSSVTIPANDDVDDY